MLYFKARMHPVRYFGWVSAPDLLAGFNWTYFYGEGVEGREAGREGVDI